MPAPSSTTTTFTTLSASPAETQGWGRALGELVRAGDFLALCGQLGGGKTCFVQGLAEGMEVAGRVSSPTYVLLHEHPGSPPLLHLDAYRLSSAAELLDLGLEEMSEEAVVALEWADRVRAAWPEDHLTIEFAPLNGSRRLHLVATGPRSQQLLREVREFGSC